MKLGMFLFFIPTHFVSSLEKVYEKINNFVHIKFFRHIESWKILQCAHTWNKSEICLVTRWMMMMNWNVMNIKLPVPLFSMLAHTRVLYFNAGKAPNFSVDQNIRVLHLESCSCLFDASSVCVKGQLCDLWMMTWKAESQAVNTPLLFSTHTCWRPVMLVNLR